MDLAALQHAVAALDDEVLRGLSEEDLGRLVAILQTPVQATNGAFKATEKGDPKDVRAMRDGSEGYRDLSAAGAMPPTVGLRGVLILCAVSITCVVVLAALLVQAGDPCKGRELHTNAGLMQRYEALLRDRETLLHEKEAILRERDSLSSELRLVRLEHEQASLDAADAWEEAMRLRALLAPEEDAPPTESRSGAGEARRAIGQQLHIGGSRLPRGRGPQAGPQRDCEPLLSAYHSQSEQLSQLQASMTRLREAYGNAGSCRAGGAGDADAERKEKRLEADLQQCREKWHDALEVHDQMRKALSQDLRRYQGVPRKPGPDG